MTGPATTAPRPLRPREHGAYGQLGLPLAAALAMGSPSAAALLLTVAAIALFIAHEPLLVLLGARGPRARRDHGGRALRIGLGWTLLAAGSGLIGLWLGGEFVVSAAMLPLGLLLILLPIVLRGLEKTLPGELVAAAALAAAAFPVAAAGDVAPSVTLYVWGAWLGAFFVTTAAVRWVIASHKKGPPEKAALWVAILATAISLLLVLKSTIFLAASPLFVASWLLVFRPPHPRGLKRVGWILLACTTLMTVLLVILARGHGS